MKLADFASMAGNIYLGRNLPVSLVHFVTNRCNARCAHCFIDFDHPEAYKNQLTLEEIEKLTLNLGPCLKNVNLTGGEPFAHKNLVDIAGLYFRNTDIESIFITTNGSLPKRIFSFANEIQDKFPDRKVIFSLSLDNFHKEHDRDRKIRDLYKNVLECYHGIRALTGNFSVDISITVSSTNYTIVEEFYKHLIEEEGVRAITAALVRDEGIYATPPGEKMQIFNAYSKLVGLISKDMYNGRLEGYDMSSSLGRMMNKKNEIMYDAVRKTYLQNRFISPCHAGALFGVIHADGMVYPCEVLEKPIGSLRDFDFDFLKLWHEKATRDYSSWIKNSKCHCTYECAWSFNILGNSRYHPALVKASLGL